VSKTKPEKKPTTENDSPAFGASLLLFGWSAFVAVVLFAPGEKETRSYHKSHGGLLALNIMIYLLLFLMRYNLSNMLRATRRVLHSPFSSTWADYEEFCMVLCVIGAALTTIFVLDFGGADVLAVRTGIVAFLIGLKAAFDRWRASKRRA
jgi:hypothetical protein